MFVEFFLSFVVIVVTTVLVWYRWRTRQLIDKIPGPSAVPLLGNALILKTDNAEFFEQLTEFCQKYGSKDGIMRMWFGPNPAVFLVSAEAAQKLFVSSKHMTKAIMYKFLKPWLGTGLLTSTGSKWQARRKHLTPTFHFKILQDFSTVFSEQARVLVDKLDKRAAADNPPTFDIYPYITMCALDIICETAMGVKINAQHDKESEYVKAIGRMGDIVRLRTATPWWWIDSVFNMTSTGKQHAHALEVLNNFTNNVIRERHGQLEEMFGALDQSGDITSISEEVIDKHREIFAKQGDGKKRLAFLDLLLYSGMCREDVLEEVNTFMFEGHDTTAAAMSWAVYLVGTHPEVQDRLQQEVDAVFDKAGDSLCADDLKELKYLECVIKEALRIYPSVAMYGRQISEQTTLAGYEIPAGTSAVVFTPTLHRDPRHFPDPEKFDPDRWSAQNMAERHPFCYVPFSAGLRNCIGQRFAMMEEKTLLAYIFRHFTVRATQSRGELRPVWELVQRPRDGIQVTLKPRHR